MTEEVKEKRKGLRKLAVNLTVLGITLTITLIVVELFLRWALWSGPDLFKGLRKPGRFASTLSPEYWLLNYYWDENNRPPKEPHPYLGWIGWYHPKSYLHDDINKARGKRPVLLFGDSFARCVDSTKCFEDILNADSSFAQENYLLNYGTGGFGLDQIYLLFKETAHRYDHPFVVFGFLNTDLDRSILQYRTGQKPYFEEQGDSIILSGYPIYANADSFFKAQTLGIKSYLARAFLFSPLNFLPWKVNPAGRGDFYYQKKIRSLNEKILKKAITDIKALDIDYVFLIYHSDVTAGSLDWRDTFLLRVLNENKVPYIWSKDLVTKYNKQPFVHADYIIPGDGHPSTLFNRLISAEIKKQVMASTNKGSGIPDTTNQELYVARITQVINKIKASESWYEDILKQAKEKNLPVEQVLWDNAVYVVNDTWK